MFVHFTVLLDHTVLLRMYSYMHTYLHTYAMYIRTYIHMYICLYKITVLSLSSI